MKPQILGASFDKNRGTPGGALTVDITPETKLRVYEGPGEETLILKISNLLVVSVPRLCTLSIRNLRVRVNGRTRITVVAVSSQSWDALVACNEPVITDLTNLPSITR
jgi:hypothetical protein